MKYLLGIDNGGTFCKAALFDEDGNQLAVQSESSVTFSPQPGFAERDMEEMYLSNVRAIHGAVEKSGIDPKEIAGVSFSGHGKGLYLVGADGKPAYHGIPSTDSRAGEIVRKWYEEGVNRKIYQKTFQEIMVMQPVPLLAWLLVEKPEVIENTRYIFSVNDYIRFRLTGEAFAEYSIASGGNLVNLSTGTYDRELLDDFGLSCCFDKLPPLRASSEICGFITKEAAELTGLAEGTPCAAGMFDVNACGVASGLTDPEKMSMIAGTWSINEYIAKEPITNGTVALNSMYCIPGYFLVEESSPTSAGNLQWFIDDLMAAEKAQAKAESRSIYDLANAWVSSIEPADSKVIFLPFLNGTNEDPLSRAAFLGLTAYHEKKHMLRAVYEGIVFSHYTHVRRLLRNRPAPESIRLSGGAANSNVWVQIFADVLQIPIDVTADKEIGCLGAAMAAGIAAGVYPDYETAAERVVRVTKTVMPRPEYAKIYAEKYEAYRAVNDALAGVWDKLR